MSSISSYFFSHRLCGSRCCCCCWWSAGRFCGGTFHSPLKQTVEKALLGIICHEMESLKSATRKKNAVHVSESITIHCDGRYRNQFRFVRKTSLDQQISSAYNETDLSTSIRGLFHLIQTKARLSLAVGSDCEVLCSFTRSRFFLSFLHPQQNMY